MKQSVLEYKKLLEQEGLLVEFAEPEGKEGLCFSAKELHSKRHT